MSDRQWAGRSPPVPPNQNMRAAARQLTQQGRQIVSLDPADRALIRQALGDLAQREGSDLRAGRCAALAAKLNN